MSEIWKDVKGFEGVYLISNFGNVKSIDRYKQNYSTKQFVKGQIIVPYHSMGYLKVCLSRNNKRSRLFIHRLIGLHFIDNPHNYKTINHIDGNKLNNKIENLEWASMSRQSRHAIEIGLRIIKSKKIVQLDLNKNLVREWDSTRTASENGFIGSRINKVILGKSAHHRGYLWQYSDDYNPNSSISKAVGL